jgi:hypothetical protein
MLCLHSSAATAAAAAAAATKAHESFSPSSTIRPSIPKE